MPVTVSIPTALRKLTNNQPSVTVQAKTVGEMFDALTKSHPEVKKHLFTEQGQLRNFVRVYVNEEDIHYIAGGKDAPLGEGDTVTIVPSIAGGFVETLATNGSNGHELDLSCLAQYFHS